MLIYESTRLDKYINNKNKFIILKSYFFLIILFILMKKTKTAKTADDHPIFLGDKLLDNEIFIIIN